MNTNYSTQPYILILDFDNSQATGHFSFTKNQCQKNYLENNKMENYSRIESNQELLSTF